MAPLSRLHLRRPLSMGVLSTVGRASFTARTLIASRIVGLERPDRALRALAAIRHWGASPAAGYAVHAALSPGRVAICDGLGTLTFADVDARTNAMARGLQRSGVGGGDGVGILCRNHRGF